MKVLLFAMPDTISALDAVMRMPNLGLCSIAGNLEGYDVKIVDLAFRNHGLTRSIRGLVEELKPDLIGLSAMSFQLTAPAVFPVSAARLSLMPALSWAATMQP